VLAREEVVLGPLQPRGAEEVEAARQVGVHLGARVLALEPVLVVGRHRLGERLATDEDRATLAGEVVDDDALVVRVRGQFVGLEDLQPGHVDQEQHEEAETEDGDHPDWSVHRRRTTWVVSLRSSSTSGVSSGGGLRAWSEALAGSATITQLAISDEPP